MRRKRHKEILAEESKTLTFKPKINKTKGHVIVNKEEWLKRMSTPKKTYNYPPPVVIIVICCYY